MLSDEEMKALDNMKSLLLYSKEHEYFSPFQEQEIDDMNIVLNIIEKQSKEIEELNKALMTATLKIEGLKIEAVYNDNYISKDKIKAKKEEVEQWELYNMKIPKLSTLDERLGAKIGIKYVLQSLLEKE